MTRHLLAITAVLLGVAASRADQFDLYTNEVLAKAIEDKALKDVPQLTQTEIAQYGDILSDSTATMLIVETNDHRFAKLLVRPGRQKIGTKTVPMLIIEKYMTFKEATERTIRARAHDVHLYPGSRLNLDLGQVVPASLTADLLLEADEKDALSYTLKPQEKAKLYVLAKPVAGVAPKKTAKFAITGPFEVKYFNGAFKVYDDGRRTGQLKLEVTESGDVTGAFYSDKDGAKYELAGVAGKPVNSISFEVKFPQTVQTFTGFMFTGDGRFITGSSKMQDREAGFYAERVEE